MKKIAFYENSDKPDAIKWAEKSAEILCRLNAEVTVRPELFAKFSEESRKLVNEHPFNEFKKYADVVISFGGDGTMLSAAREIIEWDIPLMGINVGKLGFLAEFSADRLEKSLKGLLEGDYRLVDRTVLETNINNEKIFALNDFVIEKKDSSRMITVKTYSDEHLVGDYRVDGMILTTPTGSTAYSLSCLGPIIAPSAKVLCITPISPHTLTLRPLVVPDTNEITFEVETLHGTALLVADGKTICTLANKQSVKIKLSDMKIKLIKPIESSYYDVLRTKLLWGANAFDESIIIKR